MKKPIIRLENVGKRYRLQNDLSLLSIFRNKPEQYFWALKDVNLTVNCGDRVGIVGPNGAGKTTLLRILAGITHPTNGVVSTYGKIVTLIDLEAGFHPELTGEENIYVDGYLTGMTKKIIRSKFDEVVEFADIGRFLKEPFYTYSAGMKFRLALAIALVSDCDVLLIDEIFAAGDPSFQKKTLTKIKEMLSENPNLTTVFCSHVPIYVWGFSNIFFEINKGKVIKKSQKSVLKTMSKQDKQWRDAFSISKNLI